MPFAWRRRTEAEEALPRKREETVKALRGMKRKSPAYHLAKERIPKPI